MDTLTIAAVLASLLLASGAAYFDISFFFKEKKIGVGNIFRQAASTLFLLGNGLIAVAFLWWSLRDPASPINALFSFENPFMKGIAIGLSVPLLIRSKWFSIAKEEGSKPAGVEALYDGIRGNVLHRINTWSIKLKNQISRDFARRLEKKENVPEKLLEIVKQETKPFLPDSERKEMIEEYKRYEEAYKKSQNHQDYLERLFRWAMDWCGIDPVRKHLNDLATSI
jgi:hypothetical protein